MQRLIKHLFAGSLSTYFAKGSNVYERFPKRVITLGEELQLLILK